MDKEGFLKAVISDLKNGVKYKSKTHVEKIAARYSIFNKNLSKELTELAIVLTARRIIKQGYSISETYKEIVVLYNSQVNLSQRTSESMRLQQYSTPAPISYLAGIYVQNGTKKTNDQRIYFEPSAGNGLLTIAISPEQIFVNEIDDIRNDNLKTQDYERITSMDASKDLASTLGYNRKFDGIITNPPFGTIDPVQFGDFKINTLDHVMALRALQCMKDTGRAAIIIGGHTTWDDKGRIQAGKNRIFFNYLYHHYNVDDVVMIDGHKLYSRQGTAFNTRLILINGRKSSPEGAAPLFNPNMDVVINDFEILLNRILPLIQNDLKRKRIVKVKAAAKIKKLKIELLHGLEGTYFPTADNCPVLDTVVPDSMDFETHIAVRKIQEYVGGSLSKYVKEKLKYTTEQLCSSLSAEQVDAVAMAIYNIEKRNQGTIIGDQTGIGKGRIAASIIRYACLNGYKPIFMSEKPNLFSDIYRDLAAIGSQSLVPFIINSRESKTDVKDENGEVIYRAPEKPEQDGILKSQKLPAKYDFVMATYSQFNSEKDKPVKPSFLRALAPGNIIIMDEAHNASGSSNTGMFFIDILKQCKGVAFLSATFAKRPDNMPLYALKTCMNDANMTNDQLVEAIVKGGVALQEILSAQLVSEGQMIRRERSFEGVEVNYITLDNLKEQHSKIADAITEIVRDIIHFQEDHIDGLIDELDGSMAATGSEVKKRGGTDKAGVDSTPYFSKVFNVIGQMLFSIKAEAVAERAIQRLKEGKKPIIAFANTMGSYIDSLETDDGQPVKNGDIVNADFKEVLVRGLDGVMRYTEKDIAGEPTYKKFEVGELSADGKTAYYDIINKISEISTGITISPIDVIIHRIEEAGYSVAEVTGRKWEVRMKGKSTNGVVQPRKKINTNDAFRQFNNNEVDCLLINQAGSTGASAHAIITDRVPREKVKQRCMIILQPELNINTEVQKRGRINRTGQIIKPIYDYVTSAIPAEKRLMMMLKHKLKSLDANTTSNQKQSNKILDYSDFLNKYGDEVVTEYLIENPELNIELGDPLKFNSDNKNGLVLEDAAHKVTGRVAILPIKVQEEFYSEIAERYSRFVEYLVNAGKYDLEVETMNLEAETLSKRVVKAGRGSGSSFGDDSVLEKCMCNVLRKPLTKPEIEKMLETSLQGKEAKQQQNQLIDDFKKFALQRANEAIFETEKHIKESIEYIPNEKGYQKVVGLEREQYIATRKEALNNAKNDQIRLIKTKADNQYTYLYNFFRFFYVGKAVKYPVKSIEGDILTPAIFLGYKVDFKKKNPFAPSAISLSFAIADSTRYISLVCSGAQGSFLTNIIGQSYGMREWDDKNTLDNWENLCKEANAPRRARHIVTGNLLQAFADFDGKLVSYTTLSGDVKKGILLPENWQPKKGSESVIMPIGKAKPYIIKMQQENSIITTNDIAIYSRGDSFKIISPKRGGLKEFYTDRDVISLLYNKRDGFEMVSGEMVALVESFEIPKLIDIMDERYKMSVKVTDSMFEVLMEGQKYVQSADPVIESAKKRFEADKKTFDERKNKEVSSSSNNRLRIAKVKAAAKLKLLKIGVLSGVNEPESSYNQKFNHELDLLIKRKLVPEHVFVIGFPSKILLACGVPNLMIELKANRLELKSNIIRHSYDISQIKNLPKAIHNPIAVFAYGNKEKAQNIICEIDNNGKKFIVGLFFNIIGDNRIQINSIRNVFPKDTAEWLNWIQQGKLIYIEKKKVLNLISQQRTNLADVAYLDLELITKIIKNFNNPITLPAINGLKPIKNEYYTEIKGEIRLVRLLDNGMIEWDTLTQNNCRGIRAKTELFKRKRDAVKYFKN